MRQFVLNRLEDETDISGTGIVAEGVEFHNGRVALCWLSSPSSIIIHDNMTSVEKIHGHDGKTVVEFLKERE